MVEETILHMKNVLNESSKLGRQNETETSAILNISAEKTQVHLEEANDGEDGENEVVIWAFIDGFLFLVIICGNILTIYAIIQSKKLSKIISNRFILSLAISDLLVGFMVLYHMVFYIEPNLEHFFGFCIVRLVLISLACTASVFNIVGIAIDRYVAIVHPLHYHRIMTERSARMISAIGWTLAFTIATVPIYWNNWSNNKQFLVRCEMGRVAHPLYILTMYAPLFITLYVGMCAFYIKIIKEARKQAKRMNHLNKDRPHLWKSIQTLTLVMGSFTISYMPYVILGILNLIFQRRTKTISIIYKVTVTLAVANSAVNPLIYAWKNQELKKTLCDVVHCKSINASDDLI